MTTFNSLLVSGATGWHNGGDTITYSFLGSTIPSYYERVDTDGDSVPDMIRITPGDPSTDLPLDANASMTVGERILSELAVAAWNEVANINLVPGSIDEGPEMGTPVAGDGTLVGGLGGATDFGEIEVPRNDDGSTFYDISSVFGEGLNFFGNTYTGIYVNTNGNISFGTSIGTFTPFQISGGSTPIIAPFWADVDTRLDSDEESPDSAPIFVDMDEANGVLTITWSGVGYYFQHAETTNSFQLQLFDRGGGDFDIVFRYADINWTTGDASGGDGGLGGTPARAGFSAGNGSDFFELSQSGNEGAMLALEGTTGNTGEQGLYVFKVRNGGTVGDITFGAENFTGAPSLFGFVSDFPGELGTRSNHGDLWINRGLGLQNDAQYGNTGWQTYLHELGHALGIHHPDEDPNNTAGDPRNNNQYTVMSYVVHPGQAGVPDADAAWPITPMMFDIQAMQALYGPNLDTRNTDTTYFAPGGAYALSDGAVMANGYGTILCVWDAGGEDTFSAANQTGDCVLNLNPGGFSTIGAIQNNIGLSAAVNIGGVTVNLIENAVGGAGDDTLIGNNTGNLLDGGVGADTMRGNGGNDTFMADDVDDRALEDEDDGNDLVNSLVSFALSPNVERLVLLGTAANGTGNSLDNAITGNDAANILNGAGGVDTLRGGGGDDTYVMDASADRAIEAVGAGTDLVRSSADFTLGANLENLTLIGTAIRGTGNNLVNIIIGNAANNILNGAAGADSLRGGGGNDNYLVDNGADQAIEAPGAGVDTVRSTVNFTLGVNVENLILLGTAANGTGNTLANLVMGNAAANVLNGGGGADTLRGGDGNDTYVVDETGDGVIEAVGDGTDLVRSSATFTLGNNVENLVLIGAAAINGTGNGLANMLFGNAAANILDGAAGADTMRGGGGNDTYVVDNAGDKALEGTGAGTDLVRSLLNFTLGANLEDLTLLGTAVRGNGNTLANAITGNAANNILNGAAGADTMRGGTGNDTYLVDNAGDKALEALNQGEDVVQSSVSFTLGNNVERLVLTGAGIINGTGNGLANVIMGNGAANSLNGAGGNDILSAGAGDDRLFGGTGNDDLRGSTGADRYFFDSPLNQATNVDDLLDFSRADDLIILDRTIFSGITTNGMLSLAAFRPGTVAMDDSDRILYHSGTGRIFYDADGNGTAADPILFARVTPGMALDNTDFFGVT